MLETGYLLDPNSVLSGNIRVGRCGHHFLGKVLTSDPLLLLGGWRIDLSGQQIGNVESQVIPFLLP